LHHINGPIPDLGANNSDLGLHPTVFLGEEGARRQHQKERKQGQEARKQRKDARKQSRGHENRGRRQGTKDRSGSGSSLCLCQVLGKTVVSKIKVYGSYENVEVKMFLTGACPRDRRCRGLQAGHCQQV
jgi:hypothetical protein